MSTGAERSTDAEAAQLEDEASVDEYLGFAARTARERDADADLRTAAYEGSWYRLLKRRGDTDGDEQQG